MEQGINLKWLCANGGRRLVSDRVGRLELVLPHVEEGSMVDITFSLQEHSLQPRVAGSGKGEIWMSPDFDDPLPEFEEYT